MSFVNWHPKVCNTLTRKPISRLGSPHIPDLLVGVEGREGEKVQETRPEGAEPGIHPKEWDVGLFLLYVLF